MKKAERPRNVVDIIEARSRVQKHGVRRRSEFSIYRDLLTSGENDGSPEEAIDRVAMRLRITMLLEGDARLSDADRKALSADLLKTLSKTGGAVDSELIHWTVEQYLREK